MRTYISAVAVVLFLVAAPGFAQAAVYCPSLSQTLRAGNRDTSTVPPGQVSELQRFLSAYYMVAPSSLVTGYFGTLTQTYVRLFQCEKLQICSGSESSTGYGSVGPQTRTAIAASCGTATPASASTTPSATVSTTASTATGASTSNASCQIGTYSNTSQDVAGIIQQCLNDAPVGGVVTLPPGVYRVKQPITINKSVSLSTAGKSSASAPCTLADATCAELLADAQWYGSTPGGGMLEVYASSKVTIDHIILNGNKSARWGTAAESIGSSRNLVIMGQGCTNCTFTNSVYKETLGATAFGFFGNIYNTTISKNLIANNGVHNQQGRWADGLTVSSGDGNTISYNTMLDNTDVDFIIGGCTNCTITGNKVLHSTSFAGSSFAAMMFHAWVSPNGTQITNGDYANSHIYANEVDCSTYRCGFGMYIGIQAWGIKATSIAAGSFHNNTINGAQQGISVDGAVQGTWLFNNSVTNSGGTFYTNMGTRTMGSYNVAPGAWVDRSLDTTPTSAYTSEEWNEVPNWYVQDPLLTLASPAQQATCALTVPSGALTAGKSFNVSYTTTNGATAASLYAPVPSVVPGYGSFTPLPSGTVPVTISSSGTHTIRMDVNNNSTTGKTGYNSCQISVTVGGSSSVSGGQSTCTIAAATFLGNTPIAGQPYYFNYTTTNNATAGSVYAAFPTPVPGYASFDPVPSASVAITFPSPGTYTVRMDVNNNQVTGNTGYTSCTTAAFIQ